MERTKKVTTDNQNIRKPSWKKVGGGSLRMGNRIIKPGQVFEAWPDDISPAFRRMVIPVSGDAVFNTPSVKEVSISAGVKPVYTVQPHGKSLFLFDIVTQTGVDKDGEPIYKVLNEKSLKKEAAEQLIKELNR